MPAPLNIVCFYAHLGRPYGPSLLRMTQSVKRHMPWAKTVLLTPTPFKKLMGLFDLTWELKIETTEKTLCRDKARAIVTWQQNSQADTIFVDPDIEFNRPVEVGDYDVGLLWRAKKLSQPVNAGMILARPGHDEFWMRYGKIVADLPKEVGGWWCDQLGFSILLGTGHQASDTFPCMDARVHLIDQALGCSPPEKAAEGAWAYHYKGVRKGEWSVPFFSDRQLKKAG